MAERRDHLRFKIIDILHGLRCRGRVLHLEDGILCLLCDKEWDCPCVPEEKCSTCGDSFDSPPCSLNRDLGWSGHTRAGGVAVNPLYRPGITSGPTDA